MKERGPLCGDACVCVCVVRYLSQFCKYLIRIFLSHLLPSLRSIIVLSAFITTIHSPQAHNKMKKKSETSPPPPAKEEEEKSNEIKDQ